jgi:hypothetical protein
LEPQELPECFAVAMTPEIAVLDVDPRRYADGQDDLQEFKGVPGKNELGGLGSSIERHELCKFAISIEVIESIASAEMQVTDHNAANTQGRERTVELAGVMFCRFEDDRTHTRQKVTERE